MPVELDLWEGRSQALQNREGAVGGTIIHNHQFALHILRERRGEHARDGAFNNGPFVVDRHQNGELHWRNFESTKRSILMCHPESCDRSPGGRCSAPVRRHSRSRTRVGSAPSPTLAPTPRRNARRAEMAFTPIASTRTPASGRTYSTWARW